MSISLFRSLAGQYKDLRDVNTVSMMNTISHHIEDQVIKHRMPIDFFAGFQRFSHFPAQLDRYRQLGQVCRRVYVFGVPDVRPAPISGIEYIALDAASPLAKEWFVLVDTPLFWSVLSTQEVEGRDPITGGRRFDGLWAFDAQVVDRASLLLSQALNTFYEPVMNRDHEAQNHHISEISNRMVGSLERNRITLNRQRAQMHSVRHISTRLRDSQDIATLMREAAQVLHNSFGASGVIISMFDQNNRLVILAAEGEASAKDMTPHSGGGPSRRAIEKASMIYIPDLSRDPDRDPYLPTAQALVAVPIMGRGGVHGTIVIGGKQAEQWSEDDGKTVLAMGSLLAMPLEAQHNGNNARPALNGGTVDTEKWQAPLAYLMSLNRKLRMSGALQANQVELLDQIDRLSIGLAQSIGVPEETIRRIFAQ